MRLDHVEWQLFVGPRQRSRPRTAFEIQGRGSVCHMSAVQSEVRDGFTLETRNVSCAMSDGTSATGQARCAFRGNDVVEQEVFRTSFPLGERAIQVVLGCSSFPVLGHLGTQQADTVTAPQAAKRRATKGVPIGRGKAPRDPAKRGA